MGDRVDYTIDEVMFDLHRTSYMNASKVMIATDQGFHDYALMKDKLDELLWRDKIVKFPFKVLSGMEQKETTLAIRYADEHQLTKILFPANIEIGKKLAEKFRYEDMLEFADYMIVFTNGESDDIKYLITCAKKKCVPTCLIKYNRKS